MLLRGIYTIACIVVGSTGGLAQVNLVQNGSFEDFSFCPVPGAFSTYLNDWNSQFGSPDYFNRCGTANVGIPSNVFGSQDLEEGNDGYIGVLTYYSMFVGASEIAKGNFSQPLQAGVKYRLRFRASMADNMRFSTCCIGVVLSSQPPPNPPYLVNLSDAELIIDVADYDTTTWFQLDTTYIATGGENKIYIGCFRPEAEMGVTETNANAIDGLSSAYFYIDDVEVYEDDTITNIEEGTEKPKVTVWHDATGQTITTKGGPANAVTWVFDAAGREVAVGMGTVSTLGLNGFYVVCVVDEHGLPLQTHKIVVP